jgi:hypothetical protein
MDWELDTTLKKFCYVWGVIQVSMAIVGLAFMILMSLMGYNY